MFLYEIYSGVFHVYDLICSSKMYYIFTLFYFVVKITNNVIIEGQQFVFKNATLSDTSVKPITALAISLFTIIAG